MKVIANPFPQFISATGQGLINHLEYATAAKSRAVVLLIHGMCEHQGRYVEFAEFLNRHDFTVFSLDLPGHGKTASIEDRGFFAAKDGYLKIERDIEQYIQLIQQKYPDQPLVIFGHSMGSIITRYYLINHSNTPAAVVLCGTVGPNKMSTVALKLAKAGAKIFGPRSQGKFQNILLNNTMKHQDFFDKAVQKYNWISRNKESFYNYLNDPKRSFIFTHSAYRDMLTWFRAITSSDWANHIAPDLPILIISGDKDPVGGFGKGVTLTYQQLQETNHDVTLKLYRDARHELLHEINKEEVMLDVLNWLEVKL